MMRRMLLLFVVLMSTFPFLPGCGGGSPNASSSAEESKKREAEVKASMDQGMKAMKTMKMPKGPQTPPPPPAK